MAVGLSLRTCSTHRYIRRMSHHPLDPQFLRPDNHPMRTCLRRLLRRAAVGRGRYLVTMLALVFAIGSSAQTEDDIENVYVYGVVKDVNSKTRLLRAAVLIREDSLPLREAYADSGKYELNLNFDHLYRLRYDAPGYVTKYVEIDTRNVPLAEREGGFGINVEMALFPFTRHGDYSFLNEPIGKARFDPHDSTIAWDLAWTEQMRDRIRVAKIEEDSLSKLPADIHPSPYDEEVERWNNYGVITGIIVALLGMGLFAFWMVRRRGR
jgi:hypothetical protein